MVKKTVSLSVIHDNAQTIDINGTQWSSGLSSDGIMEFNITFKDHLGFFKPGKQYFVDFVSVE